MPDRVVTGVTPLLKTLRLLRHLVKGVLIVGILFPYLKPRERDGVISQWSRDCLRILNVHVRIKGDTPPQSSTAILFVANHVSWLDILALNAVKPVRFVAKSEIRSWPVIGWLATRTGTLFLARRHPRQLMRVNRSLHTMLKRGQCVALFPEGTTSDGRTVLGFRSGLLESAVTSHSLVWPVALRYHTSDGAPDESAAFIGEQSLLASMRKIITRPALHLDLHFLPALEGSQFHRRELAHRARAAILSKLCHGPRLSLPASRQSDSPFDWSDEPTATT